MAEYYKHEIAKWNVATDDLTLEQEAAYHRVVSQIRLYERPFRENYRVLCGLWRCNERRAKRLLAELVEAGKLTIEDGFIIDEKAVNDASMLRQSRVDKASAGRLGGIQSGKSRRKPLKNNDTDEAPASTREEKRREDYISSSLRSEDIHAADANARACETPPQPPEGHGPPTFRERILAAMGLGPDGIAGPSKFIGNRADMAEAERWMALPGITEDIAVEEVARCMAGRQGAPPSKFRYFTPGMRALSAALTAPPLEPDTSGRTQPKSDRRRRDDEQRRFDAAINQLADGLAQGTVHIDTSDRDPFAFAAGKNAPPG